MKIRRRFLAIILGLAVFASAQQEDPGSSEPSKGDRSARKGGEDRGRGDHRERRGGGPRDQSAHASRFLATFDANKDKAVSFDEFKAMEKMRHLEEEGKRRIFDHLDKNKDGQITREELPRGGAPRGPARGDLDGDGKISLAEFQKNPRMKSLAPERLKEMFGRMDRDDDGFLTGKDLRRPRRDYSFDRSMMEKLDADGDEALSLEEWKNSPRLKGFPEERVEEMFRRLDRNRDGKLNARDRGEGAGRPSGGKGPPRRPRGGAPRPE